MILLSCDRAARGFETWPRGECGNDQRSAQRAHESQPRVRPDTDPNDNAPTSPKPSLDAMGKQAALDALAKRHDLDEELEWAKAELLLETLDTRGRDALDFHEIPVSAIRDLVRHAFESGYRDGLHTGYRQGRSDACDEARGKGARTQPRNPDLEDRPTSDPTT